MLNLWHSSANDKKLSRVVLIDYRKAFDHVCHNLIIEKLSMYGVPDILIRWARAFLTKRRQRVVIGRHSSECQTVRGGVPKGAGWGRF